MAYTICFAHVAYQFADEFEARGSSPHRVLVASSVEALNEVLAETEILCLAGFWRNDMLARAPRLRLIQAASAGIDNFDLAAIAGRRIPLCNARGVNAEAVAEHAIALMLSAVRQLPLSRDRQAAGQWPGMIAERAARPGELRGRTLLLVGLGAIGTRIAELAKAFGMRVIAVRRREGEADHIDAVVPFERIDEAFPEAIVCLACPLTPETENLIDAPRLARMKRSAWLVNIGRGRVVVESELVAALQAGEIGGAALDCFVAEPLPADSPLWRMPNVIITPHVAGATDRFEQNYVDPLLENLRRLEQGLPLLNEILPS